MSSAKVISDAEVDQFWSVVRACLHKFHKMTAAISRRKAMQLVKKIDRLPEETRELFYHSEPFDVACDIANHRLDLTRHLKRYLQIRDDKQGTWALPQVLRRRRA